MAMFSMIGMFLAVTVSLTESHYYYGQPAYLVPPPTNLSRGYPGSAGKRGPPGPAGSVAQCNCTQSNEEFRRILLEAQNLRSSLEAKVERSRPLKSCKQYREEHNETSNGVYTIEDLNDDDYKVYCDMSTDGGGWTLVASIHENNIGDGSTGKCTVGDKWSSEQGNDPERPGGDGNWQNRNIFGLLTAATSGDYKNPAYFELQANDIMVWQVPNDTPLRHFNSSAYLVYRTTNGFLPRYGGNLYTLYKDYYPILSGVYTYSSDNGPAIPVTFDRGDAQTLISHLPPNTRTRVDVGYIQFRPVSVHADAFAFCPGIRNKVDFEYPSQTCLGSTGKTNSITYCGDFAGLRHNGQPIGTGWSADQLFLSTTFFIFYR